MAERHDLELDLSFDGPAAARGFAARHLSVLDRDSLDDALLLVSELVTNVVRHGELPARMTVLVGADRVRVSVSDSGPKSPRIAEADHRTTSGRGLVIVAALAAAWGVAPEPSGIGKQVWFELPLSAR